MGGIYISLFPELHTTTFCGMIALFFEFYKECTIMQYSDNEAALVGGPISTCFFQAIVSASLKDVYQRVLRHLQAGYLSAADLSRIRNALAFLTLICRDNREAHKDSWMSH